MSTLLETMENQQTQTNLHENFIQALKHLKYGVAQS